MDKVLIITHDFEPLNSIGAKRPESWFNYFHKFDIHPVVLCRKWEKTPVTESDYYQLTDSSEYTIEESETGTVIRFPYHGTPKDKLISKHGLRKKQLIRKVLTLAEMIFGMRWKAFDPSPNVIDIAGEYLTTHKEVKVILATGEPWRNFRYAAEISKRFNIPWIADYRDGWSTNVSYAEGLFSKWLYQPFVRKIERRIVNTCAGISISDPCEVVKIEKIFPTKTIQTVFNGFDFGQVNVQDYKPSKEKLIISYAGSLYPFQPVEILLEGLQKFIAEGHENVEVRFIGTAYSDVQAKRILGFDETLNNNLHVTARQPHADVLKQLASSHILLLLASPETVALPAKIFEYFGLQRKILAVKNDRDVVEQLINQTSSGVICNSSDDVLQFLLSSMKELQENGFVSCETKDFEIYSRMAQANNMASFLHSLQPNKEDLN